MRTHKSIHSQIVFTTIVFSFGVIMAGELLLNPSTNVAMVLEDSQKDFPATPIEGQIIIEGEVTRVQGEFVGENFSQMNDQRYVVETPFGGKWDLHLGKNTQIIGDIFLGDQVKAKIAKNGALQMVQKIEQHGNSQDFVAPHRMTGIVERNDEDFLFVKQSDYTEHLQSDNQNLEGNSQDGNHHPRSQGGDAGYAIPIEEGEPEGKSTNIR